MEYESVQWSPYTQELLAELPPICVASRYLWTARVPLICLIDTAAHLPDRVMRQFGLAQHIPDPAPYYIGKFNQEEYYIAVATWNNRGAFTQEEREPTISLDDYNRWYWNITCRYVLAAPTEAVSENPYTPRAPLERNVVS